MKVINYTRQVLVSFLIIYLCLVLGKFISGYIPGKFPGSIIGLLICFLLLQFKIIKLEWLAPSGPILLKHMAFLFIPSAVGIVAYLHEVYSSLTLIILNIFSGIALIILVVGKLFQHYSETPEERKHRKTMYKRAISIKRIRHRVPKLSANYEGQINESNSQNTNDIINKNNKSQANNKSQEGIK